MGASRATLMRIAVNIVVDAGVGAIPVLGDLFDFAWKANLRNVAILERHQAQPVRAQRADRTFVALVACGVLALGAGLLSLGVLLTVWLVRVLGRA